MDSQQFNTVLVLQNVAGKELGFDDDGSGSRNTIFEYSPSNDEICIVIAASRRGTGTFVLTISETLAGDGGKDNLAKRQANAAVALIRMKQAEKVWPLLQRSPDPRVRSYLVHKLSSLGVNADFIVLRLHEERDNSVRCALILSSGEFSEKEFSPEDRRTLIPKLKEIYQTDIDPGLHAATEWLLRTWKQENWIAYMNKRWSKEPEDRAKRLDRVRQLLAKDMEKSPPQWYVNSHGHTMIVIPGPMEFMMGSPATEKYRASMEVLHKKRINRTFALSSKSVTVEQYLQFDMDYLALPPMYTRMANLPVVGIDWFRAARYCNWLSQQDGIPEDQHCYSMTSGQVTGIKENYLSLSGYRLPTEAEMEYATRAGAMTSRYFGETDELLSKYAWYQKNSKDMTWPVGSLKPNDLGFFDVHGGVFNWCQESYNRYLGKKGSQAFEDLEDPLALDGVTHRVLRGGSFLVTESEIRSANRGLNVPTSRDLNLGFRPARTIIP